MPEEKTPSTGKNIYTSTFIRYVSKSLLSHQYTRASQGLTYLHKISSTLDHRSWRATLACSKGMIGNEIFDKMSDKMVLYYIKLLSSTIIPQERTQIMLDLVTHYILLFEHWSGEERIKKLEEGFSRMSTFITDRHFKSSSIVLGYLGMLALGIFYFYAEQDKLTGVSEASWIPFSKHIIPNNEPSSPSSSTKRWLREAVRLLRDSIDYDLGSDFFVEFLIRALVSQAAFETIQEGFDDYAAALKFRPEWEEIQAILDNLECESPLNPAVANLRFHAAWDLIEFLPAMPWEEEGLKLVQLDPAAEYDLVFLPVLNSLFDSVEDLNKLFVLLNIIFDRLETLHNHENHFLWYSLARALVVFRNLPHNLQDSSLDKIEKLIEPRKLWWPPLYFLRDPMISVDSGDGFPNPDLVCSSNDPRHMGFLRCVCARLLLFPMPGEYILPGESTTLNLSIAPIISQSQQIDPVRSLYPDLDVRIVF